MTDVEQDAIADAPRRGRPRKERAEGEATLTVLILRKYIPADAEASAGGVFTPAFPGDVIDLPMAEAKRVVKAEIATFPDED